MSNAPRRMLMVTERALGLDQGQRYVFIVNKDNVVEYRKVQIGVLESGLRVIEDGLTPADRIIVNGMQRVRPGVTVDPKPVEMVAFSASATQPSTSSRPASAPGAAAH